MSRRFGEELVVATERAERWALFDPDPITRGQIDALVDGGDPQLIRLFGSRIGFGTAGLRAAVGPGPTQMNALVVRQTTAGVVEWLKRNRTPEPRILIGFDARPDSASFAAHAAAAVQAGGASALLSDQHVATPVVAHALLGAAADAAIVVTASHNPPADNGYKLYLDDGLQLVAPADTEIAAVIEELAAAWSDYGTAIDDAYAERDEWAKQSGQSWTEAHRCAAVNALLTTNRDVSIVYSAMHGVGGAPTVAAFAAAGFPAPHIVQEQFEPDGTFPTVAFPNPEEPGALDLALALAQAHDADAAFANDPDVDRLAIAVKDRSGTGYVPLSGNQLGTLLGDHVLSHTPTGQDRVVARSVVSSRLLDAIATQAGADGVVTLTGFKWIARPILTHAPAQYVFGFEEAIGYCVADHVRDKDGITAALVAAEMLAGFKEQGITVWDRLDELFRVHGVHLDQPINLRFDEDPGRVEELMSRVAAAPPTELAGIAVKASGPVGLGSLPPTAGLHLLTDDNTQVIIRPSGTEPKIKAYIEVIEPVRDGTVESARSAAGQRLARMVEAVHALVQA